MLQFNIVHQSVVRDGREPHIVNAPEKAKKENDPRPNSKVNTVDV